MLKQRHRQEAFDTELAVSEEARIREDERRRVLAELARDDHDGHDAHDDHDVDWRTAPPPFGEARVDDPADVTTVGRATPGAERSPSLGRPRRSLGSGPARRRRGAGRSHGHGAGW